MNTSLWRRDGSRGAGEKITDLYLITVLGIFPLFYGFSGYRDITLPKHLFFLAVTGLWLAALAVAALRGERVPLRPDPPRLAAAALLGVSLLSWAASPWQGESLLGAGRYDGLVTVAAYVLIFLGVSLCTRPKPLHAAALGTGLGLCCCVAVLQLFGVDPLRLYPEGLTYFDRDTLYSGAYLGTVGNTNILDALLCAALPLCFSLYVTGGSPLFLLPLPPCCFTLAVAGGSGAALALGFGALAAGPLLCTGGGRLRRAMVGAAAGLAPAGLGLAYHPDYAFGILTPRFALTPTAAAALGAAAVLAALGLLLPPHLFPAPRRLRRGLLALDGAAVLAGLALVLCWPGEEGTLYELGRVLRGQVDGSFGSSRVRIWRDCLALVPERPLLGGGPGTLALRLDIAFSRYVPETGQTLRSVVDNAHNVYLGWLVNCGILGLGSYLALLVCGTAGGLRSRHSMAPALTLALLCCAVHGLFGLGLSLSEPIFWAILALLCAL